jgi:hypothetical protein
MRRKRMRRRSSKRAWRNGVNRQHRKNRMDSYWMRGGIRL